MRRAPMRRWLLPPVSRVPVILEGGFDEPGLSPSRLRDRAGAAHVSTFHPWTVAGVGRGADLVRFRSSPAQTCLYGPCGLDLNVVKDHARSKKDWEGLKFVGV